MVLIVASTCWFCRVAFQKSLASILEQDFGESSKMTTMLLQWIEIVVYSATLGALVAFLSQVLNGSTMDGLSGIDLEYCRTKAGLFNAL